MSADAVRWRFLLLAACGFSLLYIAYFLVLCTPVLQWCGAPGLDVRGSGRPFTFQVTSVDQGGGADRAGVRVGDSIDIRNLSLADRWHLYDAMFGFDAAFGTPMDLSVQRGSARYRAHIVTTSDNSPLPLQQWISTFGDMFLPTLLAILLAWRRPELPEARILSLYLIAGVLRLDAFPFPKWPIADIGAMVLRNVFACAMVLLALAYFARFARPLNRLRSTLTIAAVGCAIASAIIFSTQYTSFLTLWLDPVSSLWAYHGALDSIASILTMVVGIATCVSAKGDQRQRVVYVLACLSVYFSISAILDPLRPYLSASFFTALNNGILLVEVIVPAGLTYAVLSPRMLHAGFVLNKATAIAILSAACIAIFACIEWVAGGVFAWLGHGFVLPINILTALLLGIFAPAAFRFVTDIVERYFYRRQYSARKHIERLSAGLPYAESTTAIAQVLALDACSSLALASGAVFRRTADGVFTKEASTGWAADNELNGADAEHLAIALHGGRAMLRISEGYLTKSHVPSGDSAPAVAFPLHARQQLVGFAIYSTHRAGADLDPDERALLTNMADQASRGYDAVELAERVEGSYQARVEAEVRAKETLERSSAALQRLNEAQARFMPNEFLHLLGKNSILDVALGDSVQSQMTVLFSDIRSFTTISEAMTPPEIFAYLNRYLNRAEPIISENGGFIDKYIGDAIMGLFPNTPDDALKAGIELQREVRVLNRKLANDDLPQLNIGVGLHNGSLVLGTIGGRNRMETTVIADAVNVASRLEGATKTFGCTIVLSQAMHSALAEPERFMLRYLGTLGVKGKSEKLGAYEAFDADPAELIAHKEATMERFASALAAFEAGSYAEAETAFEQIAATNSADGPAAYYLARSREQVRNADSEIAS